MASFAYTSHQSKLFIFENKLSTYFNPENDVFDILEYRTDIKKGDNGTLHFGLLGQYNADQIINGSSDNVYRLIAGKTFEISMYNINDNDGNKIFEEAFLLMHTELEKIVLDNIKLTNKEFIFHAPDVDGFHRNLKKYLDFLY